MKRALKFAAGMSVFAVAIPLTAADRDNPSNPNALDSESPQRFQIDRTERLTSPIKATEVIGKAVTDAAGEKLGKVDELAVDVESGRVSLIVLNLGGVLGVGGKTVAIPPRSFAYDPINKTLRLDVDKNKINAAPKFEMTTWKNGVTTNQITEVYRYYNAREPYFASTREVTATRLVRTERASKVVGLTVVNKENKKCGEVDNLIVDLPAGRIVHVVVSSGGILGVGDSLNAVPPSALRYTTSGDALVLNLDKDRFTRAPSFKKNDWPDFKNAEYSGKVYRAYGVEPYFSTDSDNTARNVRDRNGALTPLDQGSSEGDILITRKIRQEILSREGLSVNARNVKVITVNGRVTLRGPVNDLSEKEAINAIATRLAANGNVDNQIEVKREP